MTAPAAARQHAAPIVRRANLADAGALAALIVRAFAPYVGRLDPPPSAIKETPETIASRFADHMVLVAESAGAIVGCVFLRRAGAEIYLGRVAVDAAQRRQGVARALLDEAEAEARAWGAARLTLDVRLALEDNQRLFASCGFRMVEQRSHPGYSVPTFLRMAKDLA